MKLLRGIVTCPFVIILLIGFAIGRCSTALADEVGPPEHEDTEVVDLVRNNFFSGWELKTEVALGWKYEGSASVLMLPDCTQAFEPNIRGGLASCGGDNPMFIGYPIKLEKCWDLGCAFVGWFHLSSIFDGRGLSQKLDWWRSGDDHELHFDSLNIGGSLVWNEVWRRIRR